MVKKYTAKEARTLILNAAADLFIEKGYTNTSISDIVERLDGLTKGAVYHHFKSKDDIIEAVARRFIPKNEIFEEIEIRDDLTGLEKIQETLFEGMFNQKTRKDSIKYYDLLNETTFYSIYIQMVNELTLNRLTQFIYEGNKDGSTKVERPEQMSEIILLLISTWFINALYVTTAENFFKKIDTASDLLRMGGVDVLSDVFIKRMIDSIKIMEQEGDSI
ncbi:MAG: TetR/AcrR family transcriptional regulator [Vagococcus sp.]|uniref:TetR/AcrR family transcriptional regulator n=1 Tax=Vagococcus sp. TaxID=1933889 RepID=UPI002FC8D76C